MAKRASFGILMLLISISPALSQGHGARAPPPFGPVPSARQLSWHEMEFYGFLHFTENGAREWWAIRLWHAGAGDNTNNYVQHRSANLLQFLTAVHAVSPNIRRTFVFNRKR